MNKYLVKFLGKVTPNCDEVARLASESLDRDLSFREKIGVRFHTTICAWCVRYEEQIQKVREELRKNAEYFDDNEDTSLSEESKARMKDMLDKESGN